jgi:uncharacterized membrane protein YsdA (DUF1294 family)
MRNPENNEVFLPIFTVLFAIFVGFSTYAGKLPILVLDLYLAASIITFAVYALDKRAAQKDRWRTRESSLHLLGLLGGWPGGVIAQRVLHHKSKKRSFQRGVFAVATINSLALVWYLV